MASVCCWRSRESVGGSVGLDVQLIPSRTFTEYKVFRFFVFVSNITHLNINTLYRTFSLCQALKREGGPFDALVRPNDLLGKTTQIVKSSPFQTHSPSIQT